MVIVNIRQAKSGLPKLVARAQAGEDIVIQRRDKPAVRLVAIDAAPKKRRAAALGHLRGATTDAAFLARGAGAWKGRFSVPDSFFDPLPEEELRAWEGADEARS